MDDQTLEPEYRGPRGHASNYVGKVFVGPDALRLTKGRGNPLNDGVDMDALARVQARIDFLKHEGQLPSSYDIHSTVQLLPDRVFDTTNRATVLQAQLNNFDPEGFRHGRPLQKTLFYLDPYVTCSWCNFVSFIDVMTVRRTLAMPAETKDLGLPVESLPPCRRCGKADCFEVGSHDFSEMIANRDRLARERFERRKAAAEVILRAYRAYLRRMYAQAAAIAKKALEALQAKAATKINNSVRRRLAYRRLEAERHLREIKTCNPLLLAWALKPYTKNNKKTFWFTRDVELKLVFEDYVELGFRLGFNPTRGRMEENFAEIRRRIDERKSDLLALIQRAWRGVMARRIVKLYRKEIIRLKQLVLSRVLVLQRAYRGHYARLGVVPVLKHERQRELTLDSYLKYTENLAKERRRSDMIIKTKSAYIKDRAEERTARYTSRIDIPSEHNNRKMAAWNKSVYADARLTNNVQQLLSQQLSENWEHKMAIETDLERKAFLQARIAETGPEGFGKRSELPEMEMQIVNGFYKGPEQIAPRSKSMKQLMQAEVEKITEGIVERAAHDFRGFRLLERFKEFNSARDPDPEYIARLEAARAKFGPTAKVFSGKRKESARFRREYAFPKGINDNPMDFLDEDLDKTLALQDAKQRALEASKAEEATLNDRQKAQRELAKKKAK